MKNLTVIKIGGKVIDNREQLDAVLAAFARLEGPKILVHGGGSVATAMERRLGLEPKMVEGRRITGKAAIEVVTMVYAGLLNKQIVALLQRQGCNAIGLSGADGNSIKAAKRPVVPAANGRPATDFGFVGDISKVNRPLLMTLLRAGLTPVFSAITHDGRGQLLNTNADTLAAAIAKAMVPDFAVRLTIAFEKAGVLDASGRVIDRLDRPAFERLRQEGTITEGMIPKLTHAFDALDNGVTEVTLTSATHLINQEQLFTRIIAS